MIFKRGNIKKKYIFKKAFLCFFAFVFVLLAFPEIWFQTAFLKQVLPWTAGQFLNTKIDWSEFKAKVHRQSIRNIWFEIGFSNLNIQTKNNDQIDIPTFQTKVLVQWFNLPPRIIKIDELHSTASKIEIAKRNDDKNNVSEPSPLIPKLNIYGFFPNYIKNIYLGIVDVHVLSLQFGAKDIQASLKTLAQDQKLELQVSESSNQAQATVEAPLTKEGAVVFSNLNGYGYVVLEKKRTLHAYLKTKICQNKNTCLDGEFLLKAARTDQMSAKIKIDGSVHDEGMHLELVGGIEKTYPWLAKISTIKPCVIDYANHYKKKNEEIKTNCSLRTFLNLPSISKEIRNQFPSIYDANLNIEAQMDTASSRYTGKVSLNATPSFPQYLLASLDIRSNFSGVFKQGIEGFHHETVADLETKVPHIEKIIHLLHKTAWAIPAPINNLRGGMALKLNSHWKDWETSAPFTLTSALESSEQAFKTEADGKIDFKMNFSSDELTHLKLDANWILSDVHFFSPRLELNEIPRFFPDSRIKTNIEKKNEKKQVLVFDYDIRIKTPDSNPLRIDSNLIEDPLYFNILANLKSTESSAAQVTTKPFKFKIFRRNGFVEKMNFDLKKEVVNLDGKVRVQSGDYQVYANLSGPTDKVRVQLTSTPPVAEDELWAILLFGEPMESLNADQQDSTKSTEQALSQGGLGLFSLYAFANTPIERVNYDPATQRVGVSFRVAKGMSFEVSRSDEEVGAIGLKKRFGGGWTLKTQVSSNEKEEEKNSTQVGASLEWSARY